jgi:hypothetical protein
VQEVVTMVSARIPDDRAGSLVAAFNRAVRAGLPEQRRQTSLLRGQDGDWRIVTVWSSRSDLDVYLTSVDEPFAVRLLREAGGTADVDVLEMVAVSGVNWWP